MTQTPEALEEELRTDAASLERRGFGEEAKRVRRIADALTASLDPIRLVSESDAMARTGRTRRWLHDRFEGWVLVGAAELRDGLRCYRLCVLPPRIAFAQGAADAEKLMRAG